MKMAVVIPSLPLPVAGYGGIERAAAWMAYALAKRGHDVTVYGNVTDPNWAPPFKWEMLQAEHLVFDWYQELAAADCVLDWTHLKLLRVARLRKYVGVTMWTDKNAGQGRDIYPSRAVQTAFGDKGGRVIPLGMDSASWPTPEAPETPLYLAPGKLQDIKGQDLAIRVAARFLPKPGRFVVAGQTVAPYADPLFAMKISQQCEAKGFEFIATPSQAVLEDLYAKATGIVHTHRWLESFSLAAAAALCRGIPVLTTDQGGTQEYVRATGGGVVVPLKALDEFASAEATGRCVCMHQRGAHETDGPCLAKKCDCKRYRDGAEPAMKPLGQFFETDWAPRRAAIAKSARYLLDVDRIAKEYERVFEAA